MFCIPLVSRPIDHASSSGRSIVPTTQGVGNKHGSNGGTKLRMNLNDGTRNESSTTPRHRLYWFFANIVLLQLRKLLLLQHQQPPPPPAGLQVRATAACLSHPPNPVLLHSLAVMSLLPLKNPAACAPPVLPLPPATEGTAQRAVTGAWCAFSSDVTCSGSRGRGGWVGGGRCLPQSVGQFTQVSCGGGSVSHRWLQWSFRGQRV